MVCLAKAPIDIAAWDIKGKKAGMPLYMLLGGARNKMLSYASTPMFDTVEEYFPYLDDCIAHGFKAIKLHCYCVYEKDVALVDAVQARYGKTGIRFMLDTATFYTPEQAMAMVQTPRALPLGMVRSTRFLITTTTLINV
ncbi:hypothetical protein PWW31_28535 [Vibrio harveyi]|nr:hypothetical protein PWW31_28535 [Vibrio harveyi]